MKNLFCLVSILFLQGETYSQNANQLEAVSFTDSKNGTVVGGYDGKGIILRTTNGGNTWIAKYSGSEWFYGVCFTDSTNGTVVGTGVMMGGSIYRTVDGGNTWVSQLSGTTSELRGVSFTDANTGTAVGSSYGINALGTILRTTNGGNTWITQYNEIGSLHAVSFVDANNGTAVGGNWDGSKSEGVILRTTNGGENWIRQTAGPTSWLIDVCFTDANVGTAVGWEGAILRTTDGGNHWFSQTSGTTDLLCGVSFTDANTGTAVGEGGTILRTTDGGIHWTSQQIGTIILKDVCFTDENTGTVVGYDWNGKRNAILRTTNGGKDWVNQAIGQADTGMVTISGNVKYDNSEPAQFVYIQLYGVDSTDTYYAYTDASGNYSVRVHKDSYYMYAKVVYRNGYTLASRLTYYDNKSSLSEADLLEVNNDIRNIDFTFPVLQQGTISGTVRDAVTSQPLRNAWIGSYSGVDSTGAITDQNGHYTIPFFEGSYVLSAEAIGYHFQFYNNAYNPFDATPVTIDSLNLHVTGIDFNLVSPEPGTNTIRGQVRDKATYLLSNVQVYAIPLSGGRWTESKSDFVGNYTFRDMKNGQYILLFQKEGFAGQYYSDVYEWEDAFVFKLSGGQDITADVVYLKPLNSFGGEISGKVFSHSGSSLSGTLLSAVDSSGKVVSSIVSVYNGNYLIPYLDNGNYRITASKIGYVTCAYAGEIQIDLSSNPVAVGVDIAVNVTGIEKDETIISTRFELSQNYPNPFNPSTTIKYELPRASHVALTVYDVRGSEVATLVNGAEDPGRKSVEFNASNLASGIYFYRLQARPTEGVQAGDFVHTKKLLILK